MLGFRVGDRTVWRIPNHRIESGVFFVRAVVAEKDFRKFEFPVEEAALMRSLFGADQKCAKIFKLVFVEVSPGKLELSLGDRAHHNVLEFAGVFPWTNFVRVNVEQLNKGFIIRLRKVVVEKAGQPEICDTAEGAKHWAHGITPDFLLTLYVGDRL